MPVVRARGSATANKRFAVFFTAAWAVYAAGASGYLFLSSTMPVTGPDEPPLWGPGWVQTVMYNAAVIGLLWGVVLLPVLLLGLVYLRALRARLPWMTAWIGAVAAGFVVEVLYFFDAGDQFMSPAYVGPAVLSWGRLWQTAGFLVVGSAMIAILLAAERPAARP